MYGVPEKVTDTCVPSARNDPTLSFFGFSFLVVSRVVLFELWYRFKAFVFCVRNSTMCDFFGGVSVRESEKRDVLIRMFFLL